MAGKWCNEGKLDVAEIYFQNEAQHEFGLYLGIYKAPTIEPAEDDGLIDITEASGYGYARIALDPLDWSASGTPLVVSQPQQTFTPSGGSWGNVYGYFLTDVSSGTSGRLIAVEHFAGGPFEVDDGIPLRVTPRVTILGTVS